MFRTTLISATFVGLALIGSLATGEDNQKDMAVKPTLITEAQINGSIFAEFGAEAATQDSETGPYTAEDVERFLSSDKKFDAGMYRTVGHHKATISEPYGVNEYMHFLEGGVTLTSSDGSVMEVQAGQSVVLPKEWTGVWESDGYVKLYVIYSPDAPLSE